MKAKFDNHVKFEKSNSNSPYDQEFTTQQERLKLFLRYINRGWLAFGIVTLITLPFFQEQRSEFTYLAAVTFPTYLVVRIFNPSGKTRLAGAIHVIAVNFVFYGLFLLQAHSMGAQEAFRSEMTVWMLMGLSVLFAGALVDKRAAFLVALFNTALLIGTRQTLAPGSDPRPSAAVFWWMMAIVIWLYQGTVQQAFSKVWMGWHRLSARVARQANSAGSAHLCRCGRVGCPHQRPSLPYRLDQGKSP